jgi:hypothetical protein
MMIFLNDSIQPVSKHISMILMAKYHVSGAVTPMLDYGDITALFGSSNITSIFYAS